MAEHKITEDDLAIFPPYVSLFLLVSLLLMISHGLAATVVFFLYFEINLGIAFALSMGTSLVFVTFNFALIRGHLWSLRALKALAMLYAVVGLGTALGLVNVDVELGLGLAILIPSLAALFTLRSQRYLVMAEFIARRWRFYRETGRTVIQELELQKRRQVREGARGGD